MKDSQLTTSETSTAGSITTPKSRLIPQQLSCEPDHCLVITRRLTAFRLVIPFLTYGFLGVEIVSVTAYEAKKPRTSLAFSTRYIAWITLILFALGGIGAAVISAWDNPDIEPLQTRSLSSSDGSAITKPDERHFSILVMATFQAGYPRLAGFFNGCLIFSCLSASNTSLYVASRVLYGLCREEKPGSRPYLKWLAKLNRFNVPFWALLVSAGSFYWLPFVQHTKGYSVESVSCIPFGCSCSAVNNLEVLTVIITIGSVGTVLVWASQCLVFIRYWFFLKSHKEELGRLRQHDPKSWQKYDRWMPKNPERYQSLLWELQPFTAFVGLVFCLLTVFVFSTATFWNGDFTKRKFFSAYGGVSINPHILHTSRYAHQIKPLLCAVLWLGLKLWRRKPKFFVELRSIQQLKEIINDFERRLNLRDEDESIPLRPTRTLTLDVLQEDVDNRGQSTATATAITGPTLNDDRQERLGEILSAAGAVLDSATPHQMARRSSLSLDDATVPQNTEWRSGTR